MSTSLFLGDVPEKEASAHKVRRSLRRKWDPVKMNRRRLMTGRQNPTQISSGQFKRYGKPENPIAEEENNTDRKSVV